MRLTFGLPIVAAVQGQWGSDAALGEDRNSRDSVFAKDFGGRDLRQDRVAVGPQGQLEHFERFAPDRERREEHREERRHSERRYRPHEHRYHEHRHRHHERHVKPSWTMSMIQSAERSFRQIKQEVSSFVGAGSPDEPAESEYGAPKDHYHSCAWMDDECTCKDGEVRFGSEVSGSFTHPVMIGKGNSITCTLDDLRAKMVSVPDHEGADTPLECSCIVRQVKISFDLGVQSDSLLETGSSNKVCLVPRAHATSAALRGDATDTTSVDAADATDATEGSFAQVGRKRREMPEEDVEKAHAGDVTLKAASVTHETGEHSDLILEECDDDALYQDWIYLLSSQQIKNKQTQQCITADFNSDRGIEQIKMRDCSLVDSQLLTQRFEIPLYTPPNFFDGDGIMRLAYGAHEGTGLCLSTDQVDVYLELCKDIAGSIEWHWSAIDSHTWTGAGSENSNVYCAGEVKIGDPDKDTWSGGVPVGENEVDGEVLKDQVVCSLSALREASVHMPMVGAKTEADEPECQCRHDPYMDAEGDPKDAEELDLEETPPGQRNNKQKKLLTNEMMPIAAGGGLLLVIAAAGFFFMTHKGGLHDAYGEGEFEEEYEEEYEE